MIKAPEEGSFISETGLCVVFIQQRSAYEHETVVRKGSYARAPANSKHTAACIGCLEALAETIPFANPESRSSPVVG